MIREAQRSELPAILELWLESKNLGPSLYKSELLARVHSAGAGCLSCQRTKLGLGRRQ